MARKKFAAVPAGTGKSLKEFAALYDPRHVIDDPLPVYGKLFQPSKVYIITAAQNATPVHPEFWKILQLVAKCRKAQIVVIPLRYKNPTSKWRGSQEGREWWTHEVEPLLCNQRHGLNDNLTLMADYKIQATQSNPLQSKEAISLASSGIYGATKIHLKSVPVPASRMGKVNVTTGACTVENYTDTGYGKNGEFHHSLSALIVEVVDSKRFHMRHLHYDKDTNSVTDGARGEQYFAERGYRRAPQPLALVEGDTHVDSTCPAVESATQEMLDTLNPQYSVVHDVLDAYSCNPHHWGNPFNARAKMLSGRDDVRAEVGRAVAFIRRRAKDRKVLVVPSNHDNMLARWIEKGDWKLETVNQGFYLELAKVMSDGTQMTPGGMTRPDPFVHCLTQAAIPNVIHSPDSFVLGEVDLALHGDRGPNGARGSIKNLRRLGSKIIIGHSHSPGIDEGAYQTGTSTLLRLEYNAPPSSWLNAHVLLQHDGKRQMIIIVDGKYKA